MEVERGEQDYGSRGQNIVLFKDISYSVPLCFGGRIRKLALKWDPMRRCLSPGKPPKEVLAGVSGALRPGRLTCMLGPSGAGKTSLLRILAERKKSGVTGELVGTGRSVVLVSQEVCLMEMLTARETLSVAAEFKLPNSTKAQRDESIRTVARTLDIDHVLDLRVSKMSGGERKQLTVAQELIIDPPVLLLDEPTSGLDSVSSVGMILALQKVARTGCVVACSLQQPASRLFDLCDDVLVLGRGRTLYAGPRDNVLGELEAAGLVCPQYYNPADYLLEVAHGDHMGNLNALEDVSQMYVQRHFDEWKNGQPSAEMALIEKTHITNRAKSAEDNTRILHHAHTSVTPAPRTNMLRQMQALLRQMHALLRQMHALLRQMHALLHQMHALLRRSLVCGMRDPLLAPLRVTSHLLFALLLGALFSGIGNDASRVLTNANCLFFFFLFAFFANCMLTIQTFPSEASVVLQEHLNHWYSLTAYFLSKLAAELPLQILCPTLLVFPAWYMTDQPIEVWRVGLMWLLCYLMTLIAQTSGLLAGAAFSTKMALFVVPAVNIPMFMFSGSFIQNNEIPEYLRPISNISYFQYAFDGAVQASYGFGREALNCTQIYCHYKLPKSLLNNLGLVQNLSTDLQMLIIWLLSLQAILYLVLVVRVKLSCR